MSDQPSHLSEPGKDTLEPELLRREKIGKGVSIAYYKDAPPVLILGEPDDDPSEKGHIYVDPDARPPKIDFVFSDDGGTKHDDGKLRIELIAPEFMFAIATILTFGAKKYGDRNWEKGMLWSRVFGALMRHLWCWWGGKGPTSKSFVFGDLDSETEYSHLWHAAACVMFLVTYEERGSGTDDRMGA